MLLQPKDPINKNEVLNPLLSQIGKPLNKIARAIEVKQGDPIYFVTTLPFKINWPELAELAKLMKSQTRTETAWKKFNTEISNFYAKSNHLSSVPIWMVDELRLTKIKNSLVRAVKAENPNLIVCSTDNFCLMPGTLTIQTNRVTPLAKKGNVVRYDNPSHIAERPGYPPLSQQIKSIKKIYGRNKGAVLLLDDIGFADGEPFRQLIKILAKHGIKVIKVIGGLSWYPKAYESLQNYEPESLIWFDLPNGGWIENRDFLLFSRTGIIVGEHDSKTGELKLARRFLSDGTPLGLTVPDVAFGGRWFRMNNPLEIKQIHSFCLEHTIKIYNAIYPGLTIKQLAQIYTQKGSLFTLPIKFGNLEDQLAQVRPEIEIVNYIIKNFG